MAKRHKYSHEFIAMIVIGIIQIIIALVK